ncbi:MAG: type II secretion system F family protein [Acidimicrobiales bacterium]|nr:type II secretion system F family protein [Acidimicrobiales bacterium]
MRSTRATRLITLVLGLVVASVFAVAPAGAQSDELVVESVDATGFPLVRAVVSGPAVEGSDLDDAFVVTEDGEPVTADIVRLRGDELNVVVAMDVSGSMEGEPLDRAKVAVTGLLGTLPDSVPVAVVTFGETAVLQSTFTTDRSVTTSAVDGLIAAGGTALYDGISLGVAQLEAQGGSGALVVLADGDDTSSVRDPEAALGRLATVEHATSFVALQTEDYNAATFDGLADASGGQVVAVEEAAGFSDALREIAAGLSNSYEIRWRSSSEGGSATVEVALASTPDATASSDFDHDEVRQFVPEIATQTRTVADAGIFGSSIVLVAAALFVSAGAFLLVLAIRNSDGALERREERNQDRDARKEERTRRVSGVQERLEGLSAQMLEANDRGRSLDDTLDRAGLAVRSNEFVVATAAITVASLLVGVLLFGIPFFLLGLFFPILGIPMTLKVLTARRKKAFVSQLGDTLQLMAGSLTAGYGLGQTLDSVAREAESPTSEEFSRVVMETRLGRSLEDALDAMSIRIESADFDWVVDAIKIQAAVGGDLGEIIEQVGETIRARVRIKRQVDALTAEGKISALVLFCLPFGLAFFIFSSNPDYIEPLVSTGTGYVMLGAAGTMLTIGGLWLRKLVNPEF